MVNHMAVVGHKVVAGMVPLHVQADDLALEGGIDRLTFREVSPDS
jgi:hypothetical protein